MKRISILLSTFLAIGLFASAQIAPDKYYVQFTDKDNSPYSLGNPLEYLSQRSVDRRTTFNIPIDMKDIPVNPQYLQGVKDAGASIINPTKWLNGVTIYTTDPFVVAAIEALPYVQSIAKSPVKPGNTEVEKTFFANESYGVAPASGTTMKSVSEYDYGPSYSQISMLKGDQMHELGYTGKGIVIAVLDAGYNNADELPVFDSLWDNGQILGTRDFVDGGEITFNKHYHGTMVLSTMGGNYPGEIVGTAPDAYYYLLRTEDGSSELIIEEYNWVSGAEYADSLGADVLNTSLGYSDFPDDPSQNHTYEDMDGNTTPITIGADVAASRGMVVVNSAGNSGSSAWYYITAPADGDSVFTIGAVNSQGVPAGFSSHGPTYDGRIKPNVAAQGEGAYFANTDGSFIFGNGTSFSSPIIAGMMACLWQANPDMSNMDLINAVQASGSLADNPDNTIGYGIPDFMAAHNILTVIENDDEIVFTRMNLFPNPFTSYFVLNVSSEVNAGARMVVVDMTGRTVFENDYLISQGMNNIRVTALDNIPAGIYFLRLESGSSVITTKLIRQ